MEILWPPSSSFLRQFHRSVRHLKLELICVKTDTKKNSGGSYGVSYHRHQKTQECQLAWMSVCAYKERWVFIWGNRWTYRIRSENTERLKEHVQVRRAACQMYLLVCNDRPCKLSFCGCRWAILVLLGIYLIHTQVHDKWLYKWEVKWLECFVLISTFVNF